MSQSQKNHLEIAIDIAGFEKFLTKGSDVEDVEISREQIHHGAGVKN